MKKILFFTLVLCNLLQAIEHTFSNNKEMQQDKVQSGLKQRFIEAVQEENEQLILDCINKGVDVNTIIYPDEEYIEENFKNTTALMLTKSVTVAQALIAHGANINAESKRYHNAFIASLLNATNIDILKLLIAHKADIIDDCDFWYIKMTPLCYSAREGLYKVTQLLIKHKADVNHESEIGTPLMLAIHNHESIDDKEDNYLPIIELLISSGAKIDHNPVDDNFLPPLVVTIKERKYDLIPLFLKRGAKIDIPFDEYHPSNGTIRQTLENLNSPEINTYLNLPPL